MSCAAALPLPLAGVSEVSAGQGARVLAPRIVVQPRIVAAPWEVAKSDVVRLVHNEDGVEPERGPLELYRAAFPDRYVSWDYLHQVFAVRIIAGDRPDPALDPLHELLAYWDVDPDGAMGEATDEEIAAAAGRNPLVVRRFRNFDYPFVQQRLRERTTFLADGASKYQQRIRDRNAARKRSKIRHHTNRMAHAAGEIRRWIPVLEDYERTGRMNPGLRTAQVAGHRFTPAPTPAPPAGLITVTR